MPVSYVTGVGLVTPAGTDASATVAAVRSGRYLRPPKGSLDIPLCEKAVNEALTAATAGLPAARPASWRGTGVGTRAGLLAALEAVRAAGLDGRFDRAEIGLVMAGHNLNGPMIDRLAAVHRDAPAYLTPTAAVRHWDSDALGLISQMLGLRGEVALIGGASASGLVAVDHAHRLVGSGVMGACLVVAPAIELAAWQGAALAAAGALRPLDRWAPDPSRPFDRTTDGFVASQLAAAVVLEHPDWPSGQRRMAGTTHIGAATRLAATSGPEPVQSAERDVILAALGDADVSPGDVDYVNAHGSGSPRGDACELAALAEVFERCPTEPFVNSSKAILGHGLTSAGLVEYALTAQQLTAGEVHPMPLLTEPCAHPGVRLCSGGARTPLRLAVTASYGFGGIHAAAVLSYGFER